MSRKDAWYVADWSSKADPDVRPGPVAGSAKKSAPAEGKQVQPPQQPAGGMSENKLSIGVASRRDGRAAHVAMEVDYVTVGSQADCLLQADE